VNLIPKRDPGIIYFSILNPRIENSIPGLQSLIFMQAKTSSRVRCWPWGQILWLWHWHCGLGLM